MPVTVKKQAPKSQKKPRVSNQVKLDANNPIPFEHTGQAFSYVHNQRYTPFLPPLDNYATQLLEARLLSTTHNACVITKKDYCAGNGFQHTEGVDLDPAFVEWTRSMNLRNESATKINRNIFEAYFTFGNCPIELVRMTVAGTKKLFVYAHNFLEWRLGDENEDGIITEAIQSKLFLRQATLTADQIKKAKKLPLYNPNRSESENWFTDEKGVERTLIWYKNSVTGFPHYGLPSAVSSMIFQLLEYKGARYNLDNFDNNMVISALLALKGNLSQTEADRIGKKAIATHTGDGKRGRVMVVASEEGIDGSSLHNFDTHKEGSYNEADDKWTQKIILANQWDAVLAGIISPSTLGKGAGFITKILEIKNNTVIKPAQQDIMDEVWSLIIKLANDWLGFKIDIEKLEIKNAIDISGLTDVDITPAVTRNEVRVAKGLPEDPTEQGKEYMKSTGPVAANPKEGGDNVPA